MKMLLLSALVFLSSSAHASDEVKCRMFLDSKINAIVYSNRDLNGTVGEKLALPCTEYFMDAAQKEILPVVLGFSLPVLLDIQIMQDEQMPTIERILGNSPRTRTKVEIKSYLGGDANGMNDIRATLAAKENYPKP